MQVGLIQSTEGHKNKKLMFLREEGIPRQRSVEILPEFPSSLPALEILDLRLQLQLLPEFAANWFALQTSDLPASTIM